MGKVWVSEVEVGLRFGRLWYVPVVVVVWQSQKLATMDHTIGPSSAGIHHYQSRACSPSHHDLSNHTSSKR